MDSLSYNDCTEILHDLKIPLNVIFGYVSLLKESNLSKQQKEDLKGMENNLLFLSKMIGDLRILIQKKGIEPLFQHFDGAPLVKEEIDSFSRSYHRKIEIKVPPSIPLWSDSHFFRRILANLLENACIHSSEEKKIYFEAEKGEKDWVFQISNSSENPEETLRTLKGYSPFKNPEKRNRTTPTGLGMLVVKNLIQIVKGKIEWSQQNEETTIRIALPIPSHQ